MMHEQDIAEYYEELLAIQVCDQLQPEYTSKLLAKKETVYWLESQAFSKSQSGLMLLEALKRRK